MNANEIQLYALIGLRALAEYDPTEYARAVDISKRQLERKIELGLRSVQNEELQRLYRETKDIIENSGNQIEMSYLLQQIYTNSHIRTHYFSAQHRQETHTQKRAESDERDLREFSTAVLSPEVELVRLSVMLLLRLLRGYVPMFNVRVKNVEADCVLEPESPELPNIVIEVKTHVVGGKAFHNTAKRLKTVMSAYGRNTIGALIFDRRPLELDEQSLGDRIYVLVFDVMRNRFVGPEVDRLVERIGTLI